METVHVPQNGLFQFSYKVRKVCLSDLWYSNMKAFFRKINELNSKISFFANKAKVNCTRISGVSTMR